MATRLKTPIEALDKAKIKKKEVQEKSHIAVPGHVEKYFGWIWCVIVNQTQFDVRFIPGDLINGEMLNGPPGSSSYNAAAFGLGGNTFWGMGYRPRGGVCLTMQLDENNAFDFTVGLASVMIGNYQVSLIRGHDRGKAVDKLGTSGGLISSDKYEGADNSIKHNDVQFKINVSTSPGQIMKVVISQDEI